MSGQPTVVNKVSGGISFVGALALVFIFLRLTEAIDWSWWWVLAPLWGPVAAFFLFAIGLFVGLLVQEARSHHRKSQAKRQRQEEG